LKNLKALGVIAGIFLVGVKLFKESASIENLKYQFTKLKLVKGGLFNTQIDLTLQLSNVSSSQLNFKSFTGDLFYNESTLGLISILNPITIAPRATSAVTIPIAISNLSALKSLLSIIANKKASPEMEIKGTMNVSDVLIPVTSKINLTA
jgi:LEA14-like dessication related protein